MSVFPSFTYCYWLCVVDLVICLRLSVYPHGAGGFRLFYPRCFLLHYLSLTSLPRSRMKRVSWEPLTSCPNLPDQDKVKQSASCAAHSWDTRHQALPTSLHSVFLTPTLTVILMYYQSREIKKTKQTVLDRYSWGLTWESVTGSKCAKLQGAMSRICTDSSAHYNINSMPGRQKLQQQNPNKAAKKCVIKCKCELLQWQWMKVLCYCVK